MQIQKDKTHMKHPIQCLTRSFSFLLLNQDIYLTSYFMLSVGVLSDLKDDHPDPTMKSSSLQWKTEWQELETG